MVMSIDKSPSQFIPSVPLGVRDSLGLSIGQSDCVNYPDFHYSALERDMLLENIKQRLVFYREKFDPSGLCYIKVWDKRYVKFKHAEVL